MIGKSWRPRGGVHGAGVHVHGSLFMTSQCRFFCMYSPHHLGAAGSLGLTLRRADMGHTRGLQRSPQPLTPGSKPIEVPRFVFCRGCPVFHRKACVCRCTCCGTRCRVVRCRSDTVLPTLPDGWVALAARCSVAGVVRARALEQLALEVETDMELVGATAIEDKLQHGVPLTIANLKEAGVRVCFVWKV